MRRVPESWKCRGVDEAMAAWDSVVDSVVVDSVTVHSLHAADSADDSRHRCGSAAVVRRSGQGAELVALSLTGRAEAVGVTHRRRFGTSAVQRLSPDSSFRCNECTVTALPLSPKCPDVSTGRATAVVGPAVTNLPVGTPVMSRTGAFVVLGASQKLGYAVPLQRPVCGRHRIGTLVVVGAVRRENVSRITTSII
jgi:hypothetical protein